MLFTAMQIEGPAAVRYPRGQGPGTATEQSMRALPVGKAQVRREGRSGLAIVAVGAMVPLCERIAEKLDATLVNLRFIKPMDEELVVRIATTHRALVTVEENVVAGGAGSAIHECLAAHGSSLPALNLGIPDRFVEHGSREDCLAAAGLDAASLEAAITRWWHVPARAAAS
jgi:1-deoxy-D-xylulose-5-phosphate synthase